jgi:hypothetical protein
MADAGDSKSPAPCGRVGSTPPSGTTEAPTTQDNKDTRDTKDGPPPGGVLEVPGVLAVLRLSGLESALAGDLGLPFAVVGAGVAVAVVAATIAV